MDVNIFLSIFILIVGFILLIKGADIFVGGAANIAGNFKVSKLLIGLTIVAFGTSAPEFAVSVKSILSGNGDIVLGNVIGSNILNILLILGCAGLVHSLSVQTQTVKREIPLMIFMTLFFIVLLSDNFFEPNLTNSFSRGDGIVLILAFAVFLYYLFRLSRRRTSNSSEEELMSLKKSILFTILGIVGIVAGSNLVVDSASDIASILGVSERMISLTIVALGTSLPELVTSVTAARKGEYDLAIGNVVGSNIFNIGVVVGVPTALFGGIAQINFSYIDLAAMLLSALLLLILTYKDYIIRRKEAILLLAVFVTYYSYVILV